MQPRHRLVLLLAALSTMAYADDALVPVSEDAAVALALKNHPYLRAARAAADAAASRTDVARSEGELQVSANALATASNKASLMGSAGVWPAAPLRSQNRGSIDLNAMARYPLSTGGRIEHSIRAAEWEAAASADGVADTEVLVAWRVRVALANWREALAMQKVAEATRDAQLKTTEVVEHHFRAGKVAKFDHLRSEAELAETQQRVAQSHADALAARAYVAQALGIPESILWEPTVEPPREPGAEALTVALQSRPDLVAAGHRVDAAEAKLVATKAGYRPQVYAVGRADGIAPTEMGTSVGLTLGVIAGIPLVDGGRRRAEVEAARHAVSRAVAISDALELRVRAEVAAAQAQIQAARETIVSARVQVTAAAEGYFVAQVRYNAGKSIVVELLDSLRGLTQAQENLVAAEAHYSRACADLWRAIGVSVPAPVD